MDHISATIITHNEEAQIERCLKSLEGVADEIIVVDSYSRDNTVEICRRYNCKITQREFSGFGTSKQYATSLTTHRYVLSVDADEVLSQQLRQAIIRTKEEGFAHRVYSMSVINHYCGKPIKRCGWYPDIQIRLFNKRYANWDLRDVAEKITFPDSLRPQLLDGQLLHYRCSSPEDFNRKEDRKAGIRGRVIAAQNDSISSFTPILQAIKAYLRCYILQKGFLEGKTGRIIARRQYRSIIMAYRLARKTNTGKERQ